MSQDFNKLRNWIAENRIEKVFESLKEYSKSYPDSQNEIFTLAAKFSDARKKENLGILDNDSAQKIRSQVNFAVLELINELEKNASEVDEHVSGTAVTSETKPGTSGISAVNNKSVFISYNHNDMDTANKLRDKLKENQIDVTIDSEKMQAGGDIKEFIESCVRNTGTTISLISKKKFAFCMGCNGIYKYLLS